MVNGAGGVVQQLQSQLQDQSGDQTGIQSELELRQSQAIDFSFIRNGGAKKKQIHASRFDVHVQRLDSPHHPKKLALR